MSDTILVVGAGPCGLSAAAAAASAGRKVVLVEKEDVLGGAPILSRYAKLVPSGEWAKDAIGRMVKRVEDDANVTIHKGTKVTRVDGEFGNFTCTLGNGQTIEAGAIILGTGFTHFDSINKPEWGFGTFEDVLTTTQMEQMVGSGRIACPSTARAGAGGDSLVRGSGTADRPRVVLQDLLHRVHQPGHGDQGAVAHHGRVHLLHGHPHLRPCHRGQVVYEEQEVAVPLPKLSSGAPIAER